MKKLWLILFGLLVSAISAHAQAPCTQSPNAGFWLPPIGNTTVWGLCINNDLTELDTIVGGYSVLPTATATPIITTATNYTTANTSPVTITNFVGGFPGQTIRMFCGTGDTFTSVPSSATILVSSTFTCGTGGNISLSLTLIGSIWNEAGRGTNSGGGGGGGGGGANQSLSNLVNVALNANLLCAVAGSCNAGTQGDPFAYGFFNQINDPAFPFYVDIFGNVFGNSFNGPPGPLITGGLESNAPPPSIAGRQTLYMGDSASHDCEFLLNASSPFYCMGWQNSIPSLNGVVYAGTFPTVTTTLAGFTNNFLMGSTGGPPSFVTPTSHAMSLPFLCLDTSGSGTTQNCTTPSTFVPAAGDTMIYETTTTNTGDTTINVNSSTAAHVRKWQGSAVLAAGDLVAGKYNWMTYDGTYWEIYTIGNAPSGGGGGSITINGTTCTVGSSCTPPETPICAEFSTTDSLTVNGSTQTFATTCSIPANTLGTNNVLRVVVGGAVTTSGGPPSISWTMKLGGTTIFSTASSALPGGFSNYVNEGAVFLIQGEGVPSSSSNVLTTGAGRQNDNLWFGGGTTSTAQPVTLATNGTLTLSFSLTTTASDASTTFKLLQLLVEQVK